MPMRGPSRRQHRSAPTSRPQAQFNARTWVPIMILNEMLMVSTAVVHTSVLTPRRRPSTTLCAWPAKIPGQGRA